MDPDQLAEEVRRACLEAAAAAYEDAGIRGVCVEGRWEAAIGAIRTLDLERLIRELDGDRRSDQEGGRGSRPEAR